MSIARSTDTQRNSKRTTQLNQKRKIDAADERQKENWTLEDIIVPLISFGEGVAARDATRSKWMTVIAAMLASDTPQHTLHHYMHKAAMEIEIELRNRQSAQLGSLCIDITVPVELEAEIERRIAVYLGKTDEMIMLSDSDPTKEEKKRFCDELYNVLSVYQAMAESLSCRGVPRYTHMLNATQALFFCIVNMSRELQSMLFQRRHRWRLPQHCSMRQESILDFMDVLKRLTPLYTSHVLNSDEYVDKLRKFVFWGSLEIDDLEWIDEEDDDAEDDTPDATNEN